MNMYGVMEKAIEITKEYAAGGGSIPPEAVLEDVFNKLKELNVQVEADH